jgi:NTE family protein
MMIKASLQYNVLGKVYLIPHVNLATVGFMDFSNYMDEAITPEGSWADTFEPSSLFSAGLTASMNSFLGPIDFDISYVNDIDKIRLFFGVGLQFNRSN